MLHRKSVSLTSIATTSFLSLSQLLFLELISVAYILLQHIYGRKL